MQSSNMVTYFIYSMTYCNVQCQILQRSSKLQIEEVVLQSSSKIIHKTWARTTFSGHDTEGTTEQMQHSLRGPHTALRF